MVTQLFSARSIFKPSSSMKVLIASICKLILVIGLCNVSSAFATNQDGIDCNSTPNHPSCLIEETITTGQPPEMPNTLPPIGPITVPDERPIPPGPAPTQPAEEQKDKEKEKCLGRHRSILESCQSDALRVFRDTIKVCRFVAVFPGNLHPQCIREKEAGMASNMQDCQRSYQHNSSTECR